MKPRNILVAWEAGVEAARAVREALALLAQTGTVNVVTVKTTDDAGEAGTDTYLSAYLMRHGIHVKLREICSNGQTVADVLKQHALDGASGDGVLRSLSHVRARFWRHHAVNAPQADRAGADGAIGRSAQRC